MKKSFAFALLLSVSCSLPALAAAHDTSPETEHYKLEESSSRTYDVEAGTAAPAAEKSTRSPQIVKEDIEGGFIEKLIDSEGKIIAEKTIVDGQAERKVLNYYYPDGTLARRITALKDQEGFLADEYYADGTLAGQAVFLNEGNKIGTEKKYDANGILRQEITWVLPEQNTGAPLAERKTVRYGDIVTYYPDGAKAAVFSVGKKGTNTFYGHNGNIIKEINDAEILNFAHEQENAACDEKAVKLSLEELVELYEDEGDISYNKCGLPYRETFLYEAAETEGNTTTLISFDESGQIRRMTPYINGQKHGTEQKFDASGNLTAEINYQNGQKNGEAKGYFPNRETAFIKQYVNGKTDGTLTCYFPTGGIAAQFHYQNGLKEGTAQINSPVSRTLEFKDGKLLNTPEKKERKLTSLIAGLETPDEKCLNIADKAQAAALDIQAEEDAVMRAFDIREPEECTDTENFVLENGNYVCRGKDGKTRAVYPESYALGNFAAAEIYAPDGSRLYEISYLNRNRQGWSREFGKDGKILTEVYYRNNVPAETARSFHGNGVVKSLRSISDTDNRKVLTRYAPDGSLLFSLSYKDGEKNQAFVADPEHNKDIFIGYHDNAVETIREANAEKPYNYIDYNLALGEYAVFRENELIKGGHLCRGGEETAPVISADKAPVVDDLQPISEDDLAELDKLAAQSAKETTLPENALIPTEAAKQQAALAAKNIGPIAKPDLDELTDTVVKETIPSDSKSTPQALSKTEKFYYPNGNLRKTVKTKGTRTEEIKEYSKSGLLLTDTVYNKDGITIEKYFGSGAIRRKQQKAYDDNALTAFVSREDYYDTGKPRYRIERRPQTLLFEEKVYTPDGLKQETVQTAPLASVIKDYGKDGSLQKQTETLGVGNLVKEFDGNGKITTFSLNGKKMPLAMADNSETILKDNAKIYEKGTLKAEIKADGKQNTLIEYHPGKIIKTEIIFFNNGEISVKGYAKDGTLTKFAYLAPDGKLHIQKPAVRTIPNYRERYWVDYNNPNWIENSDKYAVKSINRLYLDTAANILAELEWDVPEQMKKLYEIY